MQGFESFTKKGENVEMKRTYEELVFEVALIEQDAVRCSNIFSVGDDAGEDIFG